MSKNLSTLTPGSLIKLNENGVPKQFLVLEYNHYGKGEVTLLRKNALRECQWGSGIANINTGLETGVKNYNACLIDTFCNVEYQLMLDSVIRGCLIDVPLPTMRHDELQSIFNVFSLMRHCFLLSINEVSGDDTTNTCEGTKFSFFSSDANRICYDEDITTKAVRWWLRSPGKNINSSSNTHKAYSVLVSGEVRLRYDMEYIGSVVHNYVRPALTISGKILVSDSVDSDGCYTVDDAVIAGEQYQKVNGVWRRMV